MKVIAFNSSPKKGKGNTGRQLARGEKMSTETLTQISSELISHQDYVKLANQYIQGELDKRQDAPHRGSRLTPPSVG